MEKNINNLDEVLEKIKRCLLNSDEATVVIEKGRNGRIFTKITPTEKIIIKI